MRNKFSEGFHQSIEIDKDLQELREMRRELITNSHHRSFLARMTENSFLLDAKRKNLCVKKLIDYYTAGPDIYELLYSRPGSKIRIPVTLVYIPSERQSVFMYTDQNGLLVINRTETATEEFFQQESLNEYSSKYIHLVKNGKIDTCYSSEEARNVYEKCPYYEHRLHMFINPLSRYVSKLRVKVKERKINQVLILTAKSPMLIRNKSLHFHKRSNSQFNGKDKSQQFVQFKHLEDTNLVVSKQNIPNIAETLESVLAIIDPKIDEFMFDCIRDPNKNLIVINIEGHKSPVPKTDVCSSQQISALNKGKIFTNSLVRSLTKSKNFLKDYYKEQEIIKKKTKKTNDLLEVQQLVNIIKHKSTYMNHSQKLIQMEDDYLDLKHADRFGRIPHNIIGISHEDKSNPIVSFQGKTSHIESLTVDKIYEKGIWTKSEAKPNREIERASIRLKQVTEQSMISKQIYINTNQISKIMQNDYYKVVKAFNLFYSKIPKNPILSPFFPRKSPERLKMISDSILKSLRTNFSITTSYIHAIHKNLGISPEVFEEFLRVIKESCIICDLSEKESEIIKERLRIFKKFIVKSEDNE